MQKIRTVVTISVFSTAILLASCGSSTKTPDTLDGKKKELADLKNQQEKLSKQIDSLEAQISRLDTSSKVGQKAKLVALTEVAHSPFTHYIDLQGNVEAENMSWVSPRGQAGVVRAVNVRQGDVVRKGQLLLKLDDAVQRNNVANAQIALDHAKDLYQRRKNLWDEKIGTEVDLINAKNAVDQAETQLKLAQDQLDFTNVYADINGTVDNLTIKIGETFAPGSQVLHLINTDLLKAVVQVPELYQERVKVGTPVKISLPGLNNKEITGVVHVTGKTINPDSRAFSVEIRLPNDRSIRSNQVAVVRIQDYAVSKTLAIPVNTLQTDEKGKYVMVASKDKENNLLAHKRSITIGQSYGDKVEVTGGLQEGDQLITDGFQGLYEGQLITIQ
ncbi:MAG: efflux RND transporter periplasmic adaptor subunit [Chitinophagaceae bacterium]|nr:efflux RND transporter periplasmic adaptor subunit [Chitinophagaceae bacterium]